MFRKIALITVVVGSFATVHDATANVLCNSNGQVTVVRARRCPTNTTRIDLTTLISSVQGPKGDPGAAGRAGKRGPTGSVGPNGPQGQKGPKGRPGAAGRAGPRGDAGPAGDKGPTGDPGAKGATGAKGAVGDRGDAGDKPGPKGPTGDKGPQGDVGPRGTLEGPQGAKGQHGTAEETLRTCQSRESAANVTVPLNITTPQHTMIIDRNCEPKEFLFKHSFVLKNRVTGDRLRTPHSLSFNRAQARDVTGGVITGRSFPFGIKATIPLNKLTVGYEEGDFFSQLICCPNPNSNR